MWEEPLIKPQTSYNMTGFILVKNPMNVGAVREGLWCASHLVRHERIHTGKKPMNVRSVGKAFRSSHQLTIHHRFHTGEK